MASAYVCSIEQAHFVPFVEAAALASAHVLVASPNPLTKAVYHDLAVRYSAAEATLLARYGINA